MKRVLALLVLMILVGACSPQSQTKDELVVGMDLSYPPFETIDQNGKPIGISVDIAKALGQYLDRPTRIENIPFAGLILSLQNKRVNCVISSMTDTALRRETISFSDPYLTIGLAMLVGKNSGIGSWTDADQEGKIIAVRQGTTGEIWAKANIKKAKLLSLDKENTAVLEVLQGRAAAFIYDQMSVWQNQQKHPEATVAVLAPIQKEHWAIGVRKNDDELRTRINQFIESFRNQGGFNNLGDTYLKPQKEAFKAQGLEFYF